MRKLFLTVFFLELFCYINAQNYTESFTLSNGLNLNVYEIGADSSGNVTIIGGFNDSLDIDPGVGVHMVYTSNLWDQGSFIASYTSNGVFRWGLSSDSINFLNLNEKPQAIKVYPDGTTYFLCKITGTVDVDPGTGTQFVTGIGEAFVVKMNADGTFSNLYRLTEDKVETANMAMDNNKDIYLLGSFAGVSFDADGGIGSKTFISNGMIDNFIVKYNSTGNIYPVFGFNFGTIKDEYGGKIYVDDKGHILIYGPYNSTYTRTMNMNPDISNPVNLSTFQSLYFAQYKSTNCALDWAYSFSVNFKVSINDIDRDSVGSIYITGKFKSISSVCFDIKTGAQGNLISNYNKNTIFIAKYDSLANFLFANTIGNNSITDIEAKKIYLGSDNQLMILGKLNTLINFDPNGSSPENSFSPTSNGDIFMAKYNKSNGTILYVNILSCSNTAEFGATYMIDSTFYIAGLFKGDIDLNPDTVAVSNVSSSTLSAFDLFVSKYHTFFRDTTTSFGIIKNNFGTSFSVFPNPTYDIITITNNDFATHYTIRIIDMNGKTVFHEETKSINKYPIEIKGARGCYLLQITDNKNRRVILKIIKK